MGTIDPGAQRESLPDSPALAPPAGVTPTVGNPTKDNILAITPLVVCVALATVLVGSRFYSRVFYFRRVRAEDYIGLLAFGFYIGVAGCAAYIIQSVGLFVHQWDVTMAQMGDFIHYYVIITTLYCCTMLFIKIAILVEWARAFVPWPTHNVFFWTCHGLIIANASLYIATVLAVNFALTIRDQPWERWIAGTCFIRMLSILVGTFNLVLDLAVLLLPHTVIWRLQLSRAQKLGISIIFSIGLIACIAAAGRLHIVITMDYFGDAIYGYSQSIIWSIAEMTAVLMVFCVPASTKAVLGGDRRKGVFGSSGYKGSSKGAGGAGGGGDSQATTAIGAGWPRSNFSDNNGPAHHKYSFSGGGDSEYHHSNMRGWQPEVEPKGGSGIAACAPSKKHQRRQSHWSADSSENGDNHSSRLSRKPSIWAV